MKKLMKLMMMGVLAHFGQNILAISIGNITKPADAKLEGNFLINGWKSFIYPMADSRTVVPINRIVQAGDKLEIYPAKGSQPKWTVRFATPDCNWDICVDRQGLFSKQYQFNAPPSDIAGVLSMVHIEWDKEEQLHLTGDITTNPEKPLLHGADRTF